MRCLVKPEINQNKPLDNPTWGFYTHWQQTNWQLNLTSWFWPTSCCLIELKISISTWVVPVMIQSYDKKVSMDKNKLRRYQHSCQLNYFACPIHLWQRNWVYNRLVHCNAVCNYTILESKAEKLVTDHGV